MYSQMYIRYRSFFVDAVWSRRLLTTGTSESSRRNKKRKLSEINARSYDGSRDSDCQLSFLLLSCLIFLLYGHTDISFSSYITCV